MFEIDPSRLDLVEEFRANPGGPHSAELTKVVNKLRTMPFADRHVIICTKRGKEWILGKVPPVRGADGILEVDDDRVRAARSGFRQLALAVRRHEEEAPAHCGFRIINADRLHTPTILPSWL